MDNPKIISAPGDSGRCAKQISKRRYSEHERNPNKWKKMTSKPLVVEEAVIEELVETNQLLTNVNKLIELSTISSDKVELIEFRKDSILLTGIRFFDLSILSDVFSLLTCPNCSTTNTPKLLDIEDKNKGLEKFVQIKCTECGFKHSFYPSPQIDSTKNNRSRGMKIMKINVRAVYGFQSTVVVRTPLTNCVVFLNMPPPMIKNGYDGLSYVLTSSNID